MGEVLEIASIGKPQIEKLTQELLHFFIEHPSNDPYKYILTSHATRFIAFLGIKSTFKNHKEVIVNTIEAVKDYIPINDALNFFNISALPIKTINRLLYINVKPHILNGVQSAIQINYYPKKLKPLKSI